jgi:hypothetical protein
VRGSVMQFRQTCSAVHRLGGKPRDQFCVRPRVARIKPNRVNGSPYRAQLPETQFNETPLGARIQACRLGRALALQRSGLTFAVVRSH